jgi:hypothetical protein
MGGGVRPAGGGAASAAAFRPVSSGGFSAGKSKSSQPVSSTGSKARPTTSGLASGKTSGTLAGKNLGTSPGKTTSANSGKSTGRSPGTNAGKTSNTNSNKAASANSGKSPGANAGKSPGTNAGKGSNTNSGKAPGTNAGKVPGSNSGKSPSTNSGKGPGTNSGKGPNPNPGKGPSVNPGKGPNKGPGKGPGVVSGKGKGLNLTVNNIRILNNLQNRFPPRSPSWIALQRVLDGYVPTAQQVGILQGMAATTEDPQVSEALNCILEAADDGSDDSEQPAAVKQTRRYLRVKNDTGEKLTLFVQYRTVTRSGAWKWFPADPGSEGAVSFELKVGEEANLVHDGWSINASCVRLWAVTASGVEMNEYRAEDFWLVEEYNDERAYYADEMETLTFTFGT